MRVTLGSGAVYHSRGAAPTQSLRDVLKAFCVKVEAPAWNSGTLLGFLKAMRLNVIKCPKPHRYLVSGMRLCVPTVGLPFRRGLLLTSTFERDP